MTSKIIKGRLNIFGAGIITIGGLEMRWECMKNAVLVLSIFQSCQLFSGSQSG
jgi:hypothetical protein